MALHKKISTSQVKTYLFISMILQGINPAVANPVTELFLLPVQYVLKEQRQSKTELLLKPFKTRE